jgi:hypothetical protein
MTLLAILGGCLIPYANREVRHLPHLEKAHRSAVAHHVYRPARMGAQVLISGNWQQSSEAYFDHGASVWRRAAKRGFTLRQIVRMELSTFFLDNNRSGPIIE